VSHPLVPPRPHFGPRTTDPAEVTANNAPRELRAQLDDVMYAELSEIPLGRPGHAVRCADFARDWTNGYLSYQFTPDGSTLTWIVPLEHLTVLAVVDRCMGCGQHRPITRCANCDRHLCPDCQEHDDDR
jgi:hypothetical protein